VFCFLPQSRDPLPSVRAVGVLLRMARKMRFTETPYKDDPSASGGDIANCFREFPPLRVQLALTGGRIVAAAWASAYV